MIGDPAVRNRGTIGGSISNNDPAADYPAAVVALNATVHTTKREIAADNFFTGMFETALEPAEIVTAVRFPKTAGRVLPEIQEPGLALRDRRRLCRPHRRRRARRGDRRRTLRLPRPRRWKPHSRRSFTPDAIKDITIPDTGLNSDIHASRRIPRPPRRRDGPPRRRRLRINSLQGRSL